MHQSIFSNLTVFDCLLNQLSFFCSRSTWDFKHQVDLIILANDSGVSLMDLFGDENNEVNLIITSNNFNLFL